jgi:hypothetical protein
VCVCSRARACVCVCVRARASVCVLACTRVRPCNVLELGFDGCNLLEYCAEIRESVNSRMPRDTLPLELDSHERRKGRIVPATRQVQSRVSGDANTSVQPPNTSQNLSEWQYRHNGTAPEVCSIALVQPTKKKKKSALGRKW